MDTNTKKQLIKALKLIDVKELYASEEEMKRKWFRFGAYDALRMACEVIIAWPEMQEAKTKGKEKMRVHLDNGKISVDIEGEELYGMSFLETVSKALKALNYREEDLIREWSIKEDNNDDE